MPKIVPIVKEPGKILRKKAREADPKEILNPKIRGLVLNMKETLKNTPSGVGLAAPQIGESLRIFIVSEEAEEIDKTEKKRLEEAEGELKRNKEKPYEEREWKYYVFINPVVKKISKKKLQGPEGCLSVSEKFGLVKRAEKITIQAIDEKGQKFTRGFARFFARVVQHELDHLDGVLFVDKAHKFIDIKDGGRKT